MSKKKKLPTSRADASKATARAAHDAVARGVSARIRAALRIRRMTPKQRKAFRQKEANKMRTQIKALLPQLLAGIDYMASHGYYSHQFNLRQLTSFAAQRAAARLAKKLLEREGYRVQVRTTVGPEIDGRGRIGEIDVCLIIVSWS